MKHSFIYLIVVLFILSGCETNPPRESDGLRNIIPTAERDRAPKNPKDVSNVQNAVPKVEVRTAAGNKSPYKVKGVVYHLMDDPTGYEAYGVASWYGEKFQGNRTSNGEIYDMYEMTAAHKTLPIPSYVRVTNVVNSKSIIVRVNDRGPFAHGRVIDLSYAGAKKLDYIKDGTAKVKVEYIDPLIYHAEPTNNLNQGQPQSNAPVSTSIPIEAASNMTIKHSAPRENVAAESGPSMSATEALTQTAVQAATQATTQATTQAASVPAASSPQYYLQTGAFSDGIAAQVAQTQISEHTAWPVVVEKGATVDQKEVYRVYIGPLPDEGTLRVLKSALMDKGLSEPLRVVK